MADLFTDENNFPYSFYLIPPLNENEQLVHLIQAHGGMVIDHMYDTIVLGDADQPLPTDLEEAHVYNYKVIEDSVKEGVQMVFMDYLIHFPTSIPLDQNQIQEQGEQEQEQEHQLANEENDGSANIDNTNAFSDPYQFEMITGVTGTSSKDWLQPMNASMRYFEAEEDKVLREEVRKRPWNGIKGHIIYEEISKLPYFQERLRTPQSLRERMRTLNFEIGYMYKEDPRVKGQLLTDQEGNYIRTASIKTKSRKFTADEDMVFCKTVFRQLNFLENERGFETVEIPTSFYNKYALVYPSHTKESYRQRFKNFLLPFGIKNYIKYFMVSKAKNQIPKPANQANPEWLKARKQFKNWKAPENDEKKDSYRLYYPNVPTEDSWIEENWYLAEVEGEADVIFENTLSRNYKPVAPSAPTTNSKEEHTSKTLSADEVEAYLNATMEQAGSKDQELDDAEFQKQLSEIFGHNNNTVDDRQATLDQSDNQQSTTLPEFVDEPTSEFPSFYAKISVNKGSPVKLDEIEDKVVFKQQIEQLLASSSNLKVKELCVELAKYKVNEYYSLYLFHRCVNNRSFIAKCIAHYVDTNGAELLLMQPGIWSSKSLQWLQSDDNDKRIAIENYHGEASSSHMLRDLERRKPIEEQLEKKSFGKAKNT